jgi:poly-gamma-glutamate capsule biosynthesis protein CapA/YwtB (metallophosphatase superfamily)
MRLEDMYLSLLILAAAAAPQSWTLTCGGDVMLNGVKAGTKPFASIAKSLKQADITLLNLEIPLTNAKTTTTHKSADEVKKKLQFILKADPKHAAYLAECGVDGVSLGNNHALDFRTKGLLEMTSSLERAGIVYTGAGINRELATRPAVLTAPDGTRVALISYATFIGQAALWHISPATDKAAGVATLRNFGVVNAAARKEFAAVVAKARKSADVVVVAVHGGVERTSVPTTYQVSLARAFIDAGADVVIGHHPHVLQGAEMYKGKPIFYSLGNIVSPRPSRTALFFTRFIGKRLVGFTVAPCKISGGKTTLLKGKEATAGLKTFNALCKKLTAKFPNKKAVALSAPYTAPAVASAR